MCKAKEEVVAEMVRNLQNYVFIGVRSAVFVSKNGSVISVKDCLDCSSLTSLWLKSKDISKTNTSSKEGRVFFFSCHQGPSILIYLHSAPSPLDGTKYTMTTLVKERWGSICGIIGVTCAVFFFFHKSMGCIRLFKLGSKSKSYW